MLPLVATGRGRRGLPCGEAHRTITPPARRARHGRRRRSKAGRFSTRPQAGEERSRGPRESRANLRCDALGHRGELFFRLDDDPRRLADRLGCESVEREQLLQGAGGAELVADADPPHGNRVCVA